MALLDDLQRVQQEGFDRTLDAHSKGRPLPVVCPYTDGDRLDAWVVGCKKAERYVDNRAQAAAAARRREADIAAFEEKLTTFLGGDEFREEFEQWLAAFIDARTR